MHGLVVDLFAGGGGASTGIEAALGRPVDVAINHSPVALAVHKANHPSTRHLEADIWEVRPREATGGQPVALLWASPDCTHFSVAKGDVPRSQGIRSLAWVVVRWAREVRPAVILLENVPEFRGWGPLGEDGRPERARMGQTFDRWRRQLERLGYAVDHRLLDASHYGAPTRRRRLFLVARCDGQAIRWPEPTHGPGRRAVHTAAECIDWSIHRPSIFERRRPLAEKTLWRIAQGIRRFVLESAEPFIVKMRGEAHSSGIVEPLHTITAQGHGYALAAPTLVQTGYGEREGQAARVPHVDKPLGTVVAGGQKHALVAAFLAKHFGGVVGQQLTLPTSTVTAVDHHALVSAVMVEPGQRHGRGQRGAGDPLSTVVAKDRHALAAATLVQFNHENAPMDPMAPLSTITSANHVAEVRAFLTAYYGEDGTSGQSVLAPLRTVTAKHRLGLVTVHGVDYQIVDIGMRMLEPHELLRAQFGRFAEAYDLTAARTKSGAVRLIGNSVCPEVAEALVRANLRDAEERAA